MRTGPAPEMHRVRRQNSLRRSSTTTFILNKYIQTILL